MAGCRVGEMALLLRTLAGLAENGGSVLSIHMVASQQPVTLVPGHPSPSSDFHGH